MLVYQRVYILHISVICKYPLTYPNGFQLLTPYTSLLRIRQQCWVKLVNFGCWKLRVLPLKLWSSIFFGPGHMLSTTCSSLQLQIIIIIIIIIIAMIMIEHDMIMIDHHCPPHHHHHPHHDDYHHLLLLLHHHHYHHDHQHPHHHHHYIIILLIVVIIVTVFIVVIVVIIVIVVIVIVVIVIDAVIAIWVFRGSERSIQVCSCIWNEDPNWLFVLFGNGQIPSSKLVCRCYSNIFDWNVLLDHLVWGFSIEMLPKRERAESRFRPLRRWTCRAMPLAAQLRGVLSKTGPKIIGFNVDFMVI